MKSVKSVLSLDAAGRSGARDGESEHQDAWDHATPRSGAARGIRGGFSMRFAIWVSSIKPNLQCLHNQYRS
jgi:hypothetical protein